MKGLAILICAILIASVNPKSKTENKDYLIEIDGYLQYIFPEDEKEYTKLINRDNPLESGFVPKNPTLSSFARKGREKYCYMEKHACMALEAFLKELKARAENGEIEGYDYLKSPVTVTNCYRSYGYQQWLFNEYYYEQEKQKNPTFSHAELVDEVKKYCNPPGESEHQSGLCCDMHNAEIGRQREFANTEAAEWLERNAYRFGFILRYPKNKTKITGVIYEPWHFRFVGGKLARYLYENDMTLEEYHNGGNR